MGSALSKLPHFTIPTFTLYFKVFFAHQLRISVARCPLPSRSFAGFLVWNRAWFPSTGIALQSVSHRMSANGEWRSCFRSLVAMPEEVAVVLYGLVTLPLFCSTKFITCTKLWVFNLPLVVTDWRWTKVKLLMPHAARSISYEKWRSAIFFCADFWLLAPNLIPRLYWARVKF